MLKAKQVITLDTKSSFIERTSYNLTTKTLSVFMQFKEYKYYDVPKFRFDGLCMSKHTGVYFNKYIKDKYDMERGKQICPDCDGFGFNTWCSCGEEIFPSGFKCEFRFCERCGFVAVEQKDCKTCKGSGKVEMK